jgi:lipid II:glycine glycyltransferase (peptidoglycan interpeptide bridge formation enzyme)
LTRLRRDKRVALGNVDTNRFTAGLRVLLGSGRARLYLARFDNEYVAGCVFGVAGGNAFYLYNGSSETALRVGATPLTLLRAMTELSEEGFERINLGGVPASARDPASPDHGLYTFKLGLGGEPALCRGGRVSLRPIRLTLFDLARSVRARTIRRSPIRDSDAG